MRRTVDQQQKLVPIPGAHPHAEEYRQISAVLDDNPEINELVHADLIAGGVDPTKGRDGMTAEQVVRATVVKQTEDFSYEDLAFHIQDSACFQSFCRIGIDAAGTTKKTLQNNIKKVRRETWEAINHILLDNARRRGIETGRKIRTDCTVEETNIHEPSDSSLLYDVVRVLARLMRHGREAGFDIDFVDHTQRAKRRAWEIEYAKTAYEREKKYRELVTLTNKTLRYAVSAITELDNPTAAVDAFGLVLGWGLTTDLEHYIPLGRKVVKQTQRRVFWGEKVPPQDKIVSIFEPHTDIIIKDRRETLFGHKLCLTTGASGLVLDCMVLDGNPADATLPVQVIGRQKLIYHRPPRQAAFDGGFTARQNLVDLKQLGVKDVMFHKKRSLKIPEMVKSSWVYKRLKRFRAGIEGNISFLKRCFGLSRCTWRSEASFKAYTWASVVSANLLVLARHLIET